MSDRRFTFTTKSPIVVYGAMCATRKCVGWTMVQYYVYEQEAAVGRSQQWRFIVHMHHAFIHPSLSVCVRSYLFRLSIYNFPHTVSEQPNVYWPTRNPAPVQSPPIYRSSFSYARKHTQARPLTETFFTYKFSIWKLSNFSIADRHLCAKCQWIRTPDARCNQSLN